MKIKKRIAAVIVAVITVMQFAFAAHAADLTKEGTLTLAANHGGSALPGIRMEIFLIAEAVSVDANGFIQYTTAPDFEPMPDSARFADFDSYSAETNRELSGLLRAYISGRNDITGQAMDTNSDGKIVFENLTAGLYFVMQAASPHLNNNQHIVQSFIVPIPHRPEDEENYNYSVIGNLKIESIPVATTPPSTSESTTTEPATTQPATTIQPTTTQSVFTSDPPVMPAPMIPPVTLLAPPITEQILAEDFEDAIIPLSDGNFALPLETEEGEDDIYQVFDEEGIPLGIITIPEDEDFEEYYDFENVIPLANFNWTEGETPKENPKTGNMLIWSMLLVFAAVSAATAVIIIKKKKADELK